MLQAIPVLPVQLEPGSKFSGKKSANHCLAGKTFPPAQLVLPVWLEMLHLSGQEVRHSLQVLLQDSRLPPPPLETQLLGVLVHSVHQPRVLDRVQSDCSLHAGVRVEVRGAQNSLVVRPKEVSGLEK